MAEPSGPGVILGDDGRVLTVVGACAWVVDQAVGSWPCINTFGLVRMKEAVRAEKIDNVVSCSTEEESLLAKHQLVFSLVACVCRVSYVGVCVLVRRR